MKHTNMGTTRVIWIYTTFSILTKFLSGFPTPGESCTHEEFLDHFPCGPHTWNETLKEYPVSGGVCIAVVRPSSPDRESVQQRARSICALYFSGSDLARTQTAELDTLITADLSPAENGYYIGLEREQGGKEFHWSGLLEKPTWYNWAREEPTLDPHHKQCVYKNSTDGLWRTSGCHVKRSFICELPSANNHGLPLLDVTFSHGAPVFYSGEISSVSCSAFMLPDDPPLYISATGRLENLQHARSPKRRYVRLSVEERNYTLFDSNRCLLRAHVSLTINVTIFMRNSSMACCRRRRRDGFETCSPPTTFEVHFLPQPPQVVSNIKDGQVHEGQHLDIKCSAFVGTGGELRWSLETILGMRWWKIELDGRVYIAGREQSAMWMLYHADDPNLPASFTTNIHSATQSPVHGPWLESVLHYEVTKVSEGALITCRTYNPDNNLLNTKELVKTSYPLKILKEKVKDAEGVWTQMIVLIALICIFIVVTIGAFLKVYLPHKYTKGMAVTGLISVVSRMTLNTTPSRATNVLVSRSEPALATSRSREDERKSRPHVEFKESADKKTSQRNLRKAK